MVATSIRMSGLFGVWWGATGEIWGSSDMYICGYSHAFLIRERERVRERDTREREEERWREMEEGREIDRRVKERYGGREGGRE